MKKLKNQIFETETEASRQREELRTQLIQDHEQILQKTVKTKEDEIGSLTKELEEALEHVENLKKIRNEEMLLAENSKEQVLIMAQHEQKSLSERLHEALANLDACQKELDKHRLDANTRLEKDRCSISELQIEVSKLRNSMQDKQNTYDHEKEKLMEKLSLEKQEQINAENETNVLKSTLKLANDREKQMVEQVQDLKLKLDLLTNDKEKTLIELNDTQKKLDDIQAEKDRVENLKVKLNETVQLLQDEKQKLTFDLEQIKMKSKNQEEIHFYTQDELNELKITHDKLLIEFEDVEKQGQHWKNQYNEVQKELHQIRLEQEQFKMQLALGEESKDAEHRQMQNLKLKINELETTKLSLEKELNYLRSSSSTDQETLRLKINTLNQTIEDIRGREKRLEDQRHQLEQQLSLSQQQVKDLNCQVQGKDGQLGELFTTIARLEASKKELQVKINNVATLLHHVRSNSSSRSRPATPTRSTSSGRRSSSPWPSSQSESVAPADADFETIKKDIRDLVTKIGQISKDRDEAHHHVVALKRQNDDLVSTNADLDEKFIGQKRKSKQFEEQLKRLESKVAQTDMHLADQVGECRRNLGAKIQSLINGLLLLTGGETRGS